MRMLRWIPLVSLAAWTFVLHACGDDGTRGTTDADSDSDTDSDSDSDTDSDSDSDTDPLDCAGGRYDASADLCWQHPKAGEKYQWQAAVDYCEGLDLGGHTDWVLPSVDDLMEMAGNCPENVLNGESGSCDSCDESATCSALFGEDTDDHWSSTLRVDDTAFAWHMSFSGGYTSPRDKMDELNIRCVHAGP